MKIQEADAKSLLAAPGPARAAVGRRPDGRRGRAPPPSGSSPAGAGRVVIKAQVLVGGRGKAGGVKLAGSAGRGRRRSPAAILGMQIKGIPVRKVLVGPGRR